MNSPMAAGEHLQATHCKCILFLGREAEGVRLLICLLFCMGQESQECPLGEWMPGAPGQECALPSGHLLCQGQFLLSSFRGAEGLLPLLPEE